ncbi:hypothetical protein BOX15_Mlig023207g1 [Macrostomum lignano]|uniref:TRPM-like domain-containing protein n=1 Tax=Macrostomum lignano TaxID=282301 RepID=A0A267E6K7_9PLAT|nr:hypothetical protein BOX15_Mlig023207g1 [Macrostomum lignano]
MSSPPESQDKGFFGSKKKTNKKLGFGNLRLFGTRLTTKRRDSTAPQVTEDRPEADDREPETERADSDAVIQPVETQPNIAELLYQAIMDDDIEALKRFANPKVIDLELHEAMRLSDVAAALSKIKLLEIALDQGAEINRPNTAGFIPIHYALSGPDVAGTVAFLLEQGANPNVALPTGDYLLHKACSDSSTVLLELLLSHGADASLVDQAQLTPLHRACINDLQEHAGLVLGAAPELINAQDADGKTPLHIAVANQNITLMKLLLDHGATVDRETTDGRTAIDVMMSNKNRGTLRELIRHFTDRVSSDTKVTKPQDLYRSRGFQEFLCLLQLIDSESRRCYYNTVGDPAEEMKLVDELLDLDEENLQDVIEFQTILMAALKTNAIHRYSENREIIDTIAIFTTKYILFREDISALNDVMKCGVLWDRVSGFLEDHISTLYNNTNRDASIISKQFYTCFMDSGTGTIGGKRQAFNLRKLNQRVAICIGMSPPSAGDDVRESGKDTLQINNPVETLAVWSILTGRFNLTLAFLRKTQFEIVPLCVLSAGILRKLNTVLEIDALQLPAVTDLADQCERVACDALTKAVQVDMSEDKWVTYQYLLQSMPEFGNLSCIHLAANCQCDSFLRLDVCQKAMDITWQRFLCNMNPWLREFAVIMGIIPMNPLLAILLYAYDGGRASSRVEQQQPQLKQKQKQNDATIQGSMGSNESFALHEDTGPATTMFDNDFSGERIFGSRKSVKAKLQIFIGLLYCFYHIPSVKFRYFTMSHVTLILIMSYTVLIDFNWTISPLEVCAYIIALGFIIEELRELGLSLWHDSFHEYGSNKWNIVDGFACLFMITAFILRLTMALREETPETFTELFENHVWFCARFFYGLACLLMWVKLLNIARVNAYFGPKLTMMSTMIIKDLLPFLYILFIYLFGFGIFMTSLMHPNGFFAYNPNQLSMSEVIRHVLHICFYSMFGEYHLDQMTGSECAQVFEARQNTSLNCPHPDAVFVVPYILLPIYIIITTILLLSLIVALFSKTIDEIDSNSRALWQFERFAFVNEYENYSALSPPLNILDVLRELLVTGLGRWAPSSPVRVKMDLFDPDVLVHYLINQAIGLRNDRTRLGLMVGEDVGHEASALGHPAPLRTG